jgi:hypothetical protein
MPPEGPILSGSASWNWTAAVVLYGLTKLYGEGSLLQFEFGPYLIDFAADVGFLYEYQTTPFIDSSEL